MTVSFRTMFGANSPTSSAVSPQCNTAAGRTEPTPPAVHALTEEEREAAIKRAGKLAEKYDDEWKATGSFEAKGRRDYAVYCMTQLIKGRSPERIAKMERDLGLM